MNSAWTKISLANVRSNMKKEYMNNMFANMKRLTNSNADGFDLLRQIMVPQEQFPPPQPH